MADHVRLTVPSDVRSLTLVEAVCEQYASGLEIPPAEGAELVGLVREAVGFTLEHAYPDDPSGHIELTLDVVDRAVHVDVHDWGVPAASAGGELGALPPGLASLDLRTDDLRLLNLGSDGKRITFRKLVSAALDTGPGAHDYESPAPTAAREDVRDQVELRDATPADAEEISKLLYTNYHLSYGHPDFYRPSWIVSELETGRLYSSLAVLEEEIIGHHALMVEEGSASAETGAAIVHPAFRGLGIFTTLGNHTLERSRELGLTALWGRAVTVHPYSQRAALARGYRETCVMLGSVPARMEMEGIDGAEAGKRTASLLGFRPLLPPQARPLAFPPRYADLLRSSLANVGLEEDAAGPQPVENVEITVSEERSRGTALVRIPVWDDRAALHAIRHALAQHVDAVYADLDLTTGAASEEALERLNGEGFFYAGLVLFGRDGHDFLRLQLLNAENIELERTVCDSAVARQILEAVVADRLRVDG